MYFANGKKENLKDHNVWEATENDFIFGIKNPHLDSTKWDALPFRNYVLFLIFGTSLFPVQLPILRQLLTWGAQLARFREGGTTAERTWERGTMCRSLPEAEADE